MGKKSKLQIKAEVILTDSKGFSVECTNYSICVISAERFWSKEVLDELCLFIFLMYLYIPPWQFWLFFINLAKMKDESVIVRAQICYDQISDYLSKTITVLACFKYKRYKKNTLTILNDWTAKDLNLWARGGGCPVILFPKLFYSPAILLSWAVSTAKTRFVWFYSERDLYVWRAKGKCT